MTWESSSVMDLFGLKTNVGALAEKGGPQGRDRADGAGQTVAVPDSATGLTWRPRLRFERASSGIP